METKSAVSEQIAREIKDYFRREGLTLTDVGERIGSTPQAVANQLNGRSIGRNVASKYAEAFGFNLSYIISGVGVLKEGYGKKEEKEKEQDGVFIPRETLELYNNLSASVLRLTELLAEKEKPAKSAPLYHNYATYQK